MDLKDQIIQFVQQFVHSSSFWKWHGFVLSILWLFGSSIGIFLKQKNTLLHVLAFGIVDYLSLFFIGCALYLIIPQLANYKNWSFIQRLHILGGLVFLLLVIYQHLDGIFTWHKEIKNSTHRKIGTRIVIFGRVLAGLGWLIVEENKYYAIVVLIISVSIYAFVEKNTWKKIKIV